MKLGEMISPGMVLTNFRAKDKWEAISSLVDVLIELHKLKPEDREAVVKALYNRENIATTGVGNGVAIPHCPFDGIEEPLCSIGISREGINFQSEDGLPAKIVVLFILPKRKINVHIRMLAAIASLINSEETRRDFIDAKSPDDVITVIKREEDKRI